jgi:hypothetical protein
LAIANELELASNGSESLKISNVSERLTSILSTFENRDFKFSICSVARMYSLSLCLIGKLTKIVFFPVSAQSVEVTAESIPPEIPMTNPETLAFSQ